MDSIKLHNIGDGVWKETPPRTDFPCILFRTGTTQFSRDLRKKKFKKNLEIFHFQNLICPVCMYVL